MKKEALVLALQEDKVDLDVRMHLADAKQIQATDEAVNSALLVSAQSEIARLRTLCDEQSAQLAAAGQHSPITAHSEAQPLAVVASAPSVPAVANTEADVWMDVLRDRTQLLTRLAEEYRHSCNRVLSVNSALLATERGAAAQVCRSIHPQTCLFSPRKRNMFRSSAFVSAETLVRSP